MFKLRDMLISVKYTLDSDDLVENKKVKYLNFYISHVFK